MTVTIHCLADVCLIPIGKNTPSVSDEVAIITKLAQDSHLETTLHSAGTTIAGPWNEVMDLIGQFHQELHDKHGILRIQSDIRVGTRTDKHQSPQDKLDVVYRKLNQNQQQQEEKEEK